MRILIAEDDATSRKVLERLLVKWGYEVVVTVEGEEAWRVLRGQNPPSIAILDWMMPGIDGIEIIRRVCRTDSPTSAYIILLTARGEKKDIVAGLEAGANDYIGKPFDGEELRARIKVGERVVELQTALAERIESLENALGHIKALQGVLLICMYCHKIRTDRESWERIEMHISSHSEAQFSHGICPECMEKHYPE